MKLLVVGSRSITNFDLTPFISDCVDTIKYANKIRKTTTVIQI